MKKFSLLVFVSFLALPLSAAAHGSFTINDRAHGGLVAHFNRSRLATDEVPDEYLRSHSGYSFGAFLSTPYGPVVAGQLELLFTSKGGKLGARFEGLEATDEFRFHYLESGYLLRLNFPVDTGTRIYGEFGPIISFLLSARWEGRISNGFESLSDSADITSDAQSVEVGAALGGGVAIPFQNVGLLLGLRHTWGLTSVAYDFDAFLRNLQFRAGVYF